MNEQLEKEIDQIVTFYSEKGMEKALKAALVGLVNKFERQQIEKQARLRASGVLSRTGRNA